MPTVTVEGEKSFEVESAKKLVLAIEDAGIDIMHRCGGNVRCTTCRVQVLAGDPAPMAELEQTRLAREASLGPDIRLSCQIRVESDLAVRVLNRASAVGVPPGPGRWIERAERLAAAASLHFLQRTTYLRSDAPHRRQRCDFAL